MSTADQPIGDQKEISTARMLVGFVIAIAIALITVGIVQNNVSGWFTDEAQATADARTANDLAQRAARTKLFADTNVQDLQPVATGEGAEALNDAEPFSVLPIEAATPFTIGRTALADRNRALKCLSQAIYYEAGYEPFSGRRAVAQVILNRLRHPAFPDSVCGVVYQGSSKAGCQFSFTCDGSLKRAPEQLAWSEAEQIAKAALAGETEPSVGMATHYHADYVFPKWASKLPKVEKIGAHLFYRWPGNWGRRVAFVDAYRGGEFIPAPSSLAGWNDVAAPELAIAIDPRLDRQDKSDRRADNDIGGRLDTRTPWRLTFSDPGQGQSSYQQTIGDQVVAEAVH